MNRIDSLRHDLVGIRHFARRLKDDEHNDPHPPPLPSARVVAVPERGEMFVRQLDGPPEGPTIILLHGWALSADVNWFCGLYDTAAYHGDVLAPDMLSTTTAPSLTALLTPSGSAGGSHSTPSLATPFMFWRRIRRQ